MNEVDDNGLKEFIHEEIKKMWIFVLQLLEVSFTNEYQFEKLRSAVLRVGNNCWRNIEKEVNSYKLEKINVNKEIIDIEERKE